jgi:aspartokinase-like uncharacterized kinase
VKSARPVVVKLGGSLATSPRLPDLLARVGDAARSGMAVVIAPGGGAFADAVRDAQRDHGFGDDAAHDMALLAMAQYGRMLVDLASGAPLPAWGAAGVAAQFAAPSGRPIVWLPNPSSDALDVERSWSVSADALALWLAARLDAQCVILVKSCAASARRSLPELSAEGIVDAAYPGMAAAWKKIATKLVYSANAESLGQALADCMPAKARAKAPLSRAEVRPPPQSAPRKPRMSAPVAASGTMCSTPRLPAKPTKAPAS